MKKYLSLLLLLSLLVSLLSGCSMAPNRSRVALLAPAQPDDAWAEMETGALRTAAELEIPVDTLPEDICSAMDAGYGVIVLRPDGSEETAAALQEAAETGVKVICLDASTEWEGAAVIAADPEEAGRAAGEAMLSLLEEKKIRSGGIGIIGSDPQDQTAVRREAGFRAVFEETGHTLLDTRYDRGVPALAGKAAGDYLRQGVAGIYSATERATLQAARRVSDEKVSTVVTGFGHAPAMDELLEEGFLRATAVPDYDAMGCEAIRAAAAFFKGDSPATILIGQELLVSPAPALLIPDLKIAVAAPSRRNAQWKSLEAGALQAAEELGCEVISLLPPFKQEETLAQQISQAVADGIHAIVAAPEGSEAVEKALLDAEAAGVMVVRVDADDVDHKAAGRLAAETMLAILEDWDVEDGDIAIFGVSEESEDAMEREAGFREAMADSPYTLLDTQYVGGDAARAHAAAEQLVWKKTAAIFCCAEGASVGAANGVKSKHSDMLVVGFGSADSLAKPAEEGVLHAAVTPDMEAMGYGALKAACAMAMGKEPEAAAANVTVLAGE